MDPFKSGSIENWIMDLHAFMNVHKRMDLHAFLKVHERIKISDDVRACVWVAVCVRMRYFCVGVCVRVYICEQR